MTTAVAKTETRNLSIVQSGTEENEQQVIPSDIIVPRLLLTQPMSKVVLAKKAQVGQMIRSTTAEVLGDETKGVSFIPLKMTTGWIEEEKVGQKFEYRKQYERTKENDGLDWSYFRDTLGKESKIPFPGSTEWRRVKTINVYALLMEDVIAHNAELKKAEESGEMPDFNKGLLPVLITFRSSSFNAGKTVNNYYTNYKKMKPRFPNLKSYAFALSLSCRIENGKKGTYYLFEVGNATKLDAETLAHAEEWYGFLNSAKAVHVDDTDMDSEDVESGVSTKF